ncbi:hypothetical protein CMV_023533 [Castanea mollissima]|uniref:Uncharacterized protein n=1 Tax=Castanea mollissima TaxID=60419 RepID=A0A8J4QJE9_9ROSI|nr:hypothetical protein CMV_023533 [Castanea mollissima]
MLNILESYDLQGFINGEVQPPPQFINNADTGTQTNLAFVKWRKTDRLVKAIGKPVPDHKKSWWLLNGLDKEYKVFTTTMLRPPVLPYSEIVTSLDSYAERHKLDAQPTPQIAFYGQCNNKNKRSNGGQGSFNSKGQWEIDPPNDSPPPYSTPLSAFAPPESQDITSHLHHQMHHNSSSAKPPTVTISGSSLPEPCQASSSNPPVETTPIPPETNPTQHPMLTCSKLAFLLHLLLGYSPMFMKERKRRSSSSSSPDDILLKVSKYFSLQLSMLYLDAPLGMCYGTGLFIMLWPMSLVFLNVEKQKDFLIIGLRWTSWRESLQQLMSSLTMPWLGLSHAFEDVTTKGGNSIQYWHLDWCRNRDEVYRTRYRSVLGLFNHTGINIGFWLDLVHWITIGLGRESRGLLHHHNPQENPVDHINHPHTCKIILAQLSPLSQSQGESVSGNSSGCNGVSRQ